MALIVFLIESYNEADIVFILAGKMQSKGDRIVFIFMDDGISHLKNPGVMGLINFADSIYVLKEDTENEKIDYGVKSIDYLALFDILEKCDNVVSWT